MGIGFIRYDNFSQYPIHASTNHSNQITIRFRTDFHIQFTFQFSGAIEGLPTAISAIGVIAVAVDQFVQDQVALGVVGQVGRLNHFVQIAPVIVQVAGHVDLALARQVHDLLLTQGAKLVFLGGDLENLDHMVGAE